MNRQNVVKRIGVIVAVIMLLLVGVISLSSNNSPISVLAGGEIAGTRDTVYWNPDPEDTNNMDGTIYVYGGNDDNDGSNWEVPLTRLVYD